MLICSLWFVLFFCSVFNIKLSNHPSVQDIVIMEEHFGSVKITLMAITTPKGIMYDVSIEVYFSLMKNLK